MTFLVDELYLFYVNNCNTLSKIQSECILHSSLKQTLDSIIIDTLNKVAERSLFDYTDLEFIACKLAYNSHISFDSNPYSHRLNYSVFFKDILLNLSIQFTLDSAKFFITLLDSEPLICNSKNGIMTSYLEYGNTLIKMNLAKVLLPKNISRYKPIINFRYTENCLYPGKASYSCFINNKDNIRIDFDHDLTATKKNKIIVTKNPSSHQLIKSLARSIKNRKALHVSLIEYGDLVAFIYYLDFFNDNNKSYFKNLKQSENKDEEASFNNEYINIYRMLKKDGIFDCYLALAEMQAV